MAQADLNKLFLGDNYSSESLLASSKDQKISLVELKDRVTKHQQDLNQNFLKLFNQNYDRFYKLSHIVTCLSEPMQALVDPIQSFHYRLKEICTSHQTDSEQIDHKLETLKNLSRDKLLARSLISLIKRHDRIESKMKSLDWSAIETSMVFLSNNNVNEVSIEERVMCDLLERLSIELHYLSCELRAINPTDNELIFIKRTLEASLLALQSQVAKAGVNTQQFISNS